MGFKWFLQSLKIILIIEALTAHTLLGMEDEHSHNKSPALTVDTAIIFGFMGISMGVLRKLPTDFTQWPAEDPDGLSPAARYLSNVQKGPVWDGDLRFFNAYAHIHIGASYQVLCMRHGYSAKFCFGYANILSLAWEYGPEAFKEIPSWQDILMTGPVGARVGQLFYIWRRRIDQSGGEVLGSRLLGYVVKFLLDPAGHLTAGVRKVIGMDALLAVTNRSQESKLDQPNSSAHAIELRISREF